MKPNKEHFREKLLDAISDCVKGFQGKAPSDVNEENIGKIIEVCAEHVGMDPIEMKDKFGEGVSQFISEPIKQEISESDPDIYKLKTFLLFNLRREADGLKRAFDKIKDSPPRKSAIDLIYDKVITLLPLHEVARGYSPCMVFNRAIEKSKVRESRIKYDNEMVKLVNLLSGLPDGRMSTEAYVSIREVLRIDHALQHRMRVYSEIVDVFDDIDEVDICLMLAKVGKLDDIESIDFSLEVVNLMPKRISRVFDKDIISARKAFNSGHLSRYIDGLITIRYKIRTIENNAWFRNAIIEFDKCLSEYLSIIENGDKFDNVKKANALACLMGIFPLSKLPSDERTTLIEDIIELINQGETKGLYDLLFDKFGLARA